MYGYDFETEEELGEKLQVEILAKDIRYYLKKIRSELYQDIHWLIPSELKEKEVVSSKQYAVIPNLNSPILLKKGILLDRKYFFSIYFRYKPILVHSVISYK
ncbi:MAG: hypothetical protein LBM96_06070 [Methanobrevibacter sp.]|nr:hypothetical protein [Candidatus Methanoflexus mossambicus]